MEDIPQSNKINSVFIFQSQHLSKHISHLRIIPFLNIFKHLLYPLSCLISVKIKEINGHTSHIKNGECKRINIIFGSPMKFIILHMINKIRRKEINSFFIKEMSLFKFSRSKIR
jgi:hypothetical protein